MLKRHESLPILYKEGIYDDHNMPENILILNPTDNQKVFQDALDSVK